MITNVTEPMQQPTNGQMPELSGRLVKDLVQVFKLLSDETRLRILLYLAQEEEMHVTALCDILGQYQPAVSHHLAMLRAAGVIERRREGKHNYYSIRAEYFRGLMDELFGNVPAEDRWIQFDEYVLRCQS